MLRGKRDYLLRNIQILINKIALDNYFPHKENINGDQEDDQLSIKYFYKS